MYTVLNKKKIWIMRIFKQPFGRKFFFNGFYFVSCWLTEGLEMSRMGILKDDKVLFINICVYEGGNYNFNYINEGNNSSSSRITFQWFFKIPVAFHSHMPYTKINPEWFNNLNIRQNIRKLLEENIGKTFTEINHTNVFLGRSPKAIEIKAKINKWALSKLKSFCIAREAISKMKRQPTEWEKYSVMWLKNIYFPK